MVDEKLTPVVELKAHQDLDDYQLDLDLVYDTAQENCACSPEQRLTKGVRGPGSIEVCGPCNARSILNALHVHANPE